MDVDVAEADPLVAGLDAPDRGGAALQRPGGGVLTDAGGLRKTVNQRPMCRRSRVVPIEPDKSSPPSSSVVSLVITWLTFN
ncbi:hypothetical protein [Solwaraspora sp. WMMA2101]|uniref:hypothetical protein n=1 Tax=Solwaraspora sp. WMMA2101 TaxID=3404124 RepID=UPI003B95B561